MKKKDDIRELLGKIRKLQNENQQIHLKSFNDGKKLLKENISLLKEEDFQEVTTEEQKDEENKFKETVSK